MKKIYIIILLLVSIALNHLISFEVDLNQLSVQQKTSLDDFNNQNYKFSNNDIVEIIVELEEDSLYKQFSLNQNIEFNDYLLSSDGVQALKYLDNIQNSFINDLIDKEIEVVKIESYTTLLNAVSLKTKYSNIEKIENELNVKSVSLVEVYNTQISNTFNVESVSETITNSFEYQGEGMLVSVLDSGFNLSHEIFNTQLSDSKIEESDIKSLYKNTNAYLNDNSYTVSDFYFNSKVPYKYDYSQSSVDIYSNSSDGMITSGIIAGKTGIAPNAQLALMKIADDKTNNNILIKALEDALLIGSDVINISYGDAAGFANEDTLLEDIFNTLEAQGVNVITSVGNGYTSTFNGSDKTLSNTNNPDYGMVNSPSSYLANLSVATAILEDDEVVLSDESSWGVLPSLEFKPDITGLGYMYTSLNEGYGYVSSTNASSAYIAGATTITKQYILNNFDDLSNYEVGAMTNSLMMSTTTILNDENNNPYSIRKQGAGFVDILASISTEAYLSVKDKTKSKIELYDDPNKTGIYEFEFIVNNISDESKTYNLNSIIMTQSVSQINSKDNYEFLNECYMLSGNTEFSVYGINKTQLTVSSNSKMTVNVKITLSEEDKKYLDNNFLNGMFVEGYIILSSDSGDLSIPYLGFYGDWTDAPIFDSTIYDNNTADMFDSYILGTKGRDTYKLGSYMFTYSSWVHGVISPSVDKISLGYSEDSINEIDGIYLSLLRNAKSIEVQVIDTITKEVVYTEFNYNCRKTYVEFTNNSKSFTEFSCLNNFSPKELGLSNNTEYEVLLSAKLDYNSETTDNLSFSFTVDFEPPKILEHNFYTKDSRTYLEFVVSDNHFAQAAFIGNLIDGEFSKLSTISTPIFNEKGDSCKVTIEISHYLSSLNNKIAVLLYDYALNESIYEFDIEDISNPNFELNFTEYYFNIHDRITISQLVKYYDIFIVDIISVESNNSDVCYVDSFNGLLIASSSGEAIVTVYTTYGEFELNVYVYFSDDDNYHESDIDEITIYSVASIAKTTQTTSYYTSSIGSVGAYKNINESLTLHNSESFTLDISLSLYYISNLTTTISIIGESCINNAGVITAVKEGVSTINILVESPNYKSASFQFDINVTPDIYVVDNELIRYFGNSSIITLSDEITRISNYAFLGNQTVNYVIANNLLSIGKYAFYNCISLVQIDLSKVTEIGQYAFYQCFELSSVDLSSLNNVESNTFFGCSSLSSVEFSVVEIQKLAFAFCSSLKYVVGEITIIEEQAFLMCEKLSIIDLSKTIYIGKSSFELCTSLNYATFNNINIIDEEAFSSSSIEEVSFINEGYIEINNSAFKDSNVSQIIFSNNSNFIIKEEAFSNTNLVTLNLTNSLFVLSELSFSNTKISTINLSENTILSCDSYSIFQNTNFESINVNDNIYYTYTNNILFTKDLSEVVLIPLNISSEYFTIPKEIEILKENMFEHLGIKYLDFEDGSRLHTIDTKAFINTQLVSIDLSNTNLNNIKSYAFYNCTNLINITLPDSLEVIGSYAFYNTSLSEIDLSNTSIGILNSNTFASSKLEVIKLPNSLELIRDNVFNNSLLKTIDLSNTVVNQIGEKAFYNTNITKLTFPNSLQIIDDYAFYGNLLTDVEGLDNVIYFGKYSFSNTSINNLEFSVDALIDEYAFSNSRISNILFNDNVFVSIGAFSNTLLESVKFKNNSFIEISELSFAYNKYLVNFDFTKINYIPYKAFYDNTSLENADLSNILIIEDYGLFNAPITNINLLSITYIGYKALSGNNSEIITLNNDLEYISDRAFYNSYNTNKFVIEDNKYYFVHNDVLYKETTEGLVLLSYPSNKQDESYIVLEQTYFIAHSAIANNKYIEEITLPSTLKIIDDYALDNCVNLSHIIFTSKEAPILRGSYNEDYLNNDYNYSHFKTNVLLVEDLIATIPTNSTGYDSLIYSLYFDNINIGNDVISNLVSEIMFRVDKITNISLSDKEEVVYIRTLVNLVNSIELELLKPYVEKLICFEEYLEIKQLTLDVITSIDLIPQNVTLLHVELVVNAREILNKVTNEEELIILVSYIEKLENAESTIEVKQLTLSVMDAIDLIPDIVSFEDEELIINARELLDKVENEEELKSLKSYIEKLEDAEMQFLNLKPSDNKYIVLIIISIISLSSIGIFFVLKSKK
ncbi:MAG: leucine-rich repeat protein [bacterium]